MSATDALGLLQELQFTLDHIVPMYGFETAIKTFFDRKERHTWLSALRFRGLNPSIAAHKQARLDQMRALVRKAFGIDIELQTGAALKTTVVGDHKIEVICPQNLL